MAYCQREELRLVLMASSAMSFIERSKTVFVSCLTWMLTLNSSITKKLFKSTAPHLLSLFPCTFNNTNHANTPTQLSILSDKSSNCRRTRSVTGSPLLSSLLLLPLLILTTSLIQLNVCSAQKLFFTSHPTSIVIPHIKYGQGLNKWSFLSVDRDNHGLHSDLLCPNPLITFPGGGVSGRTKVNGGGNKGNTGGGGRRQQNQLQQHNQNQNQQNNRLGQPLPNEIWAVKTDESMSILPCGLRQYAVPTHPFNNNGNNLGVLMTNSGGGMRHSNNNGHFIENRILFMNVSLVPFNFRGATSCTKYIQLMYDEEEGTNLRCRDIPFDNKYDNKYHIDWPETISKRKEYFSLLDNLEKFLKSEKTYQRQFYFQVYFTSFNGRTKRCTVQQYELDLSYPAGNARFCNLTQTGGYQELCGEFNCGDLIFPLYPDPKPHADHDGKHKSRGGVFDMNEEEDDEDYEDEEDYEEGSHEHDLIDRTHHPKEIGDSGSDTSRRSSSHQTHNDDGDKNNNGSTSWSRMLRLDIRLLIFVTVVPLVLFGILIFGLELIIYFMCCRKRRGEETEENRDRSHQLLQNSLNVWENVPSREAQRTVSFSPMTTNIYGERKNIMMVDSVSLSDHPETPKILKSALKKHGEHSSPPSAAHHYFEYDHDMPPSYIETTTR